MRKILGGLLGLFIFLGAFSAYGQGYYYEDRARESTIMTDMGLGFTASPTSFLLALEGGYFITHNFSLGALMQFALEDNGWGLTPTLNAKWVFDIPTMNFWQRVKPFGQFGLGLAYASIDNVDDDVGFAMNFGFGANVYINTNMAVGSSMLFNIFPDQVLGDRFLYSWQVITFSYHF